MSVDIFGRQWMNKQEIHKGSPGIGFDLTVNADFDINNKRLCNVHDPIESNDAVTLSFLEEKLDEFGKSLIDELIKNFQMDKVSYGIPYVKDIAEKAAKTRKRRA